MSEETKPTTSPAKSGISAVGRLVGVLFLCFAGFEFLNSFLTPTEGAIQQAVTSVWLLTATVAAGFGSVLLFR